MPVVPPQGSESGAGYVGGPSASPGVATAIARSVQQIPFDDSIDSTYALECFFQMPERVVQINDIKIWVQRKPFRRYVNTVSSAAGGGVTSSSSGGSQTPTTSSGGSVLTGSFQGDHVHSLLEQGGYTTDSYTGSTGGASGNTGSSTPTTGAQQQLHTHAGGATEAQNHTHQVTHDHSLNNHTHLAGHFHTYSKPYQTQNGGNHQHTVDTTHNHSVTIAAHQHTTDTSHNHTLTLNPGIYEEPLSGTISIYASDTGLTGNYAGPVFSGAETPTGGTTLRSYFTKTKGDKRVRINGTALMRVQVLIVMDLILELGV